MPAIRRQFGKGEGVPRKDLAMAALGVEVEGDKGFKGDRGSKGSEDEIRLSAQEKKEAERSEQPLVWDQAMLEAWIKKFNIDTVDFNFYIDGDRIRTSDDVFDTSNLIASDIPVEFLPPGLDLRWLGVTAPIHTLPRRLHIRETLFLHEAPDIKSLPPDLRVDGTITLRNTQNELIREAQERGLNYDLR